MEVENAARATGVARRLAMMGVIIDDQDARFFVCFVFGESVGGSFECFEGRIDDADADGFIFLSA